MFLKAIMLVLFPFDLTNTKNVITRMNFNYDNFNDYESPILNNDVKEPEIVGVVIMNEHTPNLIHKTDNVYKNHDRSSEIVTNLERKIEDNNKIEDTSGSESYSSEEEGFGLGIKQDIDNVDNTGNVNVQILRKACRSCNRRAYRRCKEACISAYKITCSEFYCSKRWKKCFRKSCKTNCRRNFDL